MASDPRSQVQGVGLAGGGGEKKNSQLFRYNNVIIGEKKASQFSAICNKY